VALQPGQLEVCLAAEEEVVVAGAVGAEAPEEALADLEAEVLEVAEQAEAGKNKI
jgi:hypothetical protein